MQPDGVTVLTTVYIMLQANCFSQERAYINTS